MSRLRTAIFAVLVLAVAAATALPPVALTSSASATDAATVAQKAKRKDHASHGGPLRQARGRLSDARSELSQARQEAAVLLKEADTAADDQQSARRDMGNFVRQAYVTGPADMVGLATLFDAPNPTDTMHRAAVATRVAEHQESQWEEAQRILEGADRLRNRARDVVHSATIRYHAAQATLNTIRGRDILREIGEGQSRMNGVATLADKCAKADVTVDVCAKSGWKERNLTLDSVLVERYAHIAWPELRKMYGYRPWDPFPDHPSGRATDLMMPHDGTTKEDVALGNDIAKFFQENAAQFGIYYMIWRQRIWRASDPIGQWTKMSDRGSPTANHMDHVHVSVTNGHAGTAWDEALGRAEAAQE